MIVKIQQSENSVERVENKVITTLYNAHINGNISQELNNDNQKVGLIGSIQADGGYEIQVSTLTSAYPKFHISVGSYLILFEDPRVEAVLAKYFGDGTGCTIDDLSSITRGTFQKKIDNKTAWQVLNENNTSYAFPELQYFTGMGNNLLFYMMDSEALTNAPTGASDIVLPYNVTTVEPYRLYQYKNIRRLRSNGKIRHIDDGGFMGCGSQVILTREDYANGDGIVLDFSEMDATSFNQSSFSNNFYGDVILKSGIWDGTVDFQMPYTNIKKIVFPSDFDSKSLNFTNNTDRFVVQRDYIFLGTTPPQHFSTGWPTSFNINGSSGSYTFYFPNNSVSSYNNVGIGESSNSYTLSDYANISDDNKDELVSYGCTATGSTGNWTIKAPGET